jgi:peptide/nickel transport system substrate-binding protein
MAPSLAESWSATEDGMSYSFVLRDGVTFHDGEKVTAEDVKFSFERYRGAAKAPLHDRVASVETPDARHVTFKLKDPWPDFITFYAATTGAGWIVPKKYVEKVGDDGFKKAPIGTGPFKFVSFTPGVELVMEAYEGYWRKTANVKRIVLKVIPEEATRLAALKRGEVDIAYSIRGELAEELQRTPGLTLKPAVTQATFWLYFADQWDPKSPWHDERVRQAARLALDLKTINQALTLGASHITGSLIPDNFEFFWKPQWLRCRLLQLRQLVFEPGRGDERLSRCGRDTGEAAAAGARFVQPAVRGQETEEHRAGRQRVVRQCSDPPRDFRREGGCLCLWQLPRSRRAVRAAGGRARSWQTRGNPQQDAADRLRAGHHHPPLAACLHQWHRTSCRRVRVRPDSWVRLYRAL